MVRRIKPVIRIIEIDARVSRVRRGVIIGSRHPYQLTAPLSPAVDIFEKEEDLVIQADVPGIQAEDLTVSVMTSRVEVRGIKRDNRPSGEARFLRLEREDGPFLRSIPLPAAVDPDRVKGFLKNGVLTIVMKKIAAGKKEHERHP